MSLTTLSAEQLRKKYDFRWEVFDIIISGKSSIDSIQGFQLSSHDDADRFVSSYGYDLENPIERAQAFGNFHESLNFIRRYFLQPENPDGAKLEIPRKIVELTDIRDLFLMSSLTYPGQSNDRQGLALRGWACSVLKVMHTVAHIDQDVRTSYFADVQQQIFDRFYKVIHRDEEGRLYLGERADDPLRVNLIAFDSKPKKSRDSTLLKLLHKPENVAEDIFDRVGLRFVTPSRLDALRVVKYLKDKMIVMPPNIKPSRSRNTLIDLEAFRAQLETLFERASKEPINEETALAMLEDAAHPQQSKDGNLHSSEYYRAIQFTCRQLIKLKNPLFEDLKELKGLAKAKHADEEILKLIDRVDLKYLQREVRFFYPYEVQVVDQTSFEENEKGKSAHSEYKRAQIQTAMRRVMGSLLDVVR
jgi:uncharacterized protein (TIGR04562 family)